MSVWLLNFTPVPSRQNQGYLYFLNTQSGVKTIEYFHCTCMITIMNLSKVFTPSLNTGNKWEYSGTSSVLISQRPSPLQGLRLNWTERVP